MKKGRGIINLNAVVYYAKNQVYQILRFKKIWEIHRNLSNHAIFENFSPLSAKKKHPAKKRIWLKDQTCVEVFFSKSHLFSDQNLLRQGCFLRSLYGWDHDEHTPSWCRSREPRQGKESGWLYWLCKTWCFFHNFFGFQRFWRDNLMMWCHNNDGFFFLWWCRCRILESSLKLFDFWRLIVIPFLAQNHHFWQIWAKNDEDGWMFLRGREF